MKQLLIITIVLCFTAIAKAQYINDSIAIKQLLEKESATWRSGDVKAHADCWQIQPYSKMLASTPDGKSFDVPLAIMINPPAGMMGKGGRAVMKNIMMSIHGNDAWVSHDEISIASDSTKSYSHEIRILEKIDNQWKLVAQSIHVYKPSN